MPHITIEYSANLAKHHDIAGLVGAVHAAALEHELVAIEALRTRGAARSEFRIADGDPANAFVAVHVEIGPGRAQGVKRALIEDLLSAAERHVERENGPFAIAWSIQLTELDAELRINHNHIRNRMYGAP